MTCDLKCPDAQRHPQLGHLVQCHGSLFVPARPTRMVESRCGAVAVGRTYLCSASFVRRCLSGSAMTPFPHPAHRTGQADLPHPALGQDFTPLLSRATPSAVSEPLRS